MPLPLEIYSVASATAIDRAAIDDAGISGFTLMTRAAEAALANAIEAFPDTRRWQVVCGAGNNGGDGYVMARLARANGLDADVIAATDPNSLHGDAATAYAEYIADGGVCESWAGELDGNADLLIDALLGIGLRRNVQGAYAEIVRKMNAHAAPVVALDIPSGIDGDTGKVQGVAVDATQTTTFVGIKSGLLLADAPDFVGDLKFAGLGIPATCRLAETPQLHRIDQAFVKLSLPARNSTANKGDFGRLLVVGGGEGMPGAVQLCGEAALRCGAGRVSIATHPAHAISVTTSRPELMSRGVESATALAEMIDLATVVALGPGLGTGSWAKTLLSAVIEKDVPIVVDADALNLLCEVSVKRDDWILTPHPGEAARLLHTDSASIQRDRRSAVIELQQKFGGSIVLKGSGSLVYAGRGVPKICLAGNPGMAAPGMGDLLTGVIAALCAQGLSGETAAAVGVYLHARAGDDAAIAGERGMCASDLLPYLRQRVNPE